MSANPKSQNPKMTIEEFYKFEEQSDIRHKYLQGHVVAMAGASRRHNQITSTLNFLLYGHLRDKDCEVNGGEMMVKIETVNVLTYPDFSVFCGEPKFTEDTIATLLNPILIIEILSPSTESYDPGKKFQYYRELPSLQEYVLISQDSARIERFVRKANNIWELSDASGLHEAIILTSIGYKLMLADVYENVNFDDEEN